MSVDKESVSNAIRSEYLKSDMIIGIERLLFIEESIDDLAGHIINGEMKMCDLIIELGVRRSVHLDEFAEISAAGPAGMSL